MIPQSPAQVWFIIAAMAVGTYLIRWSFLGLIGNRPLPAWLIRHLRYTPVAVLPGLVAPLVIWPEATGGSPDPARMAAALVTLALGAIWKNTLLAIVGGGVTLYTALALLG